MFVCPEEHSSLVTIVCAVAGDCHLKTHPGTFPTSRTMGRQSLLLLYYPIRSKALVESIALRSDGLMELRYENGVKYIKMLLFVFIFFSPPTLVPALYSSESEPFSCPPSPLLLPLLNCSIFFVYCFRLWYMCMIKIKAKNCSRRHKFA
jgi:hypothetical protein